VTLCDIDGWTYVALPASWWDGAAWDLPDQADGIGLDAPVAVSEALGERLIAASRFIRLTMAHMGARPGLMQLGMVAPAVVHTVLGELGADRWTIPADGETPATVWYTTDEIVHFSVDGEVHEVAPENRAATLEVTADAIGPVEIKVRDKQALIITATAT